MIPQGPVFVDTVHLIGVFLESDQWHEAATIAAAETIDRQKVTSEGVFHEFLAHVSRSSSRVRSDAAGFVRDLRENTRFAVVEHRTELVEAALNLYDGEFRFTSLSLQDCIAIQIMRDFGITDILTADQEFALAGVTPLLRRYA